MVERTVVALDLSKTSTGFAVGKWDQPTGHVRIARFGTIRPPAVARGARWYYPVVESIIAKLEESLADEPWFAPRDFSLAIEACVYGESSSEFQFYLTQDVLRWAARLGVDVCTYAPNTLKAWVRRWSARELPKKLGKVEIEQVWRTELRPRCPQAFPSSIQATDDAVDAGWLALLGLYAQAHILPTSDPGIGQAPPFWEDPDALRKSFLKAKLNDCRNLGNVDLSGSYGNLRDNKHLSTQGKGFYPFRQLQLLTRHFRAVAAGNPDLAFATAFERKRPEVSAKAIREALASPSLSCALDAAGHLLLLPGSLTQQGVSRISLAA